MATWIAAVGVWVLVVLFVLFIGMTVKAAEAFTTLADSVTNLATAFKAHGKDTGDLNATIDRLGKLVVASQPTSKTKN